MNDILDHIVIAILGLVATSYAGSQRLMPGTTDPANTANTATQTSPVASTGSPPPAPIPTPAAPMPTPTAPAPAPTAPPPVYPPQPPTIAEPPTCHTIAGPTSIARNADLGSGLFLHADGQRVGLGWVVPPRRRPGPEEVSFAWLNLDGSFNNWVSEGQPSRQRDVGQSSSLVAQAIPYIANGDMAPRVDRRYVTPDGRWHFECGDVGNVFASMVQVEPDLPPVLTADWNAMFWCRTADVEQNPFVIVARTPTNPDGTLRGDVTLFATRTASAPVPDQAWHLRFDPEIVARASDPSDKLRDVGAPSKVSVVETPSGYGVTFIHRGRLHVGWLNANLVLQGDLQAVRSLGSTPGRATMQWNGREVVMVFADRPNSHATYTLQVIRVPFGGTLPPPAQLPASPLLTDSDFAPGLARMEDGSFLLSWTHGLDGSHEGPSQNIYVRRYDDAMNPRGGALWLASGMDSSEVVALPRNRAVLVAMQGNGSTRDIVSYALDCDR